MTPTLEEGKIVGIEGGVDFSFKQHPMTTNVVSIGSMHGSSIAMSFSMSCVTIKIEVVVFAYMATS
jgi:hypothetical protein